MLFPWVAPSDGRAFESPRCEQNLSFQARECASLCLFDEIDAALDTQRTQALAHHIAARRGSQAIFVSHRPPMIEAAERLVGVYSVGTSSDSVCVSLGVTAAT